MSKPRDQAKEQFWRQTLARWQRSGLSVSAFCRQHHLAPPAFFRWRKLLQRRDQDAAPPCPPPAAPAPLFVPLQVRSPAPAPPAAFEVVLRCGRLLRLAPGFDPDSLKLLLALLEDEPC